jgi:hypothetical protein
VTRAQQQAALAENIRGWSSQPHFVMNTKTGQVDRIPPSIDPEQVPAALACLDTASDAEIADLYNRLTRSV